MNTHSMYYIEWLKVFQREAEKRKSESMTLNKEGRVGLTEGDDREKNLQEVRTHWGGGRGQAEAGSRAADKRPRSHEGFGFYLG